MKVTCPECNFTSEIPEDKIPPTAQLATCPKCQAKFKFRDLGEDPAPIPEMDTDEISHPVPEEEYYRNAEFQPETTAQEEMRVTDQDYAEKPEPVEKEQPYSHPQDMHHAQPEQEDKSDIWQRLDSMKPDNGIEEEEEEYEYAAARSGNETEIPFENLEKYGFFPGLFLTIKQVILSPASFFRNMPLKGFLMPLFFFVLLAEFQEICNFFWTMTGVETSIGTDVGKIMNDSMIADSLSDGTASSILSLFLYPLMLAGISFPLIGVTHILLMIFGAGDRGYQATFRATTYSYAPIILCVVPFVGDMVGAVISMAISIIAYKNIHNTTYMRVVLSMIMPFVLLLVILGFYMQFNQPTI